MIERGVKLLGPEIQHRLDMETKYGPDWPDKPVSWPCVCCRFLSHVLPLERSGNLATRLQGTGSVCAQHYMPNFGCPTWCNSYDLYGKLVFTTVYALIVTLIGIDVGSIRAGRSSRNSTLSPGRGSVGCGATWVVQSRHASNAEDG